MAISPFAPNQDNEEAIKEVIPFNFDEVYAFTSKKFAEKGYDLEEGSNNMMLATTMSYLISMLNANTAVNINETLLPLARKRKMVLQNARLLGYEVQHILSFRYRLTLEFPAGQHNINRYSKFTAGNKTYYYMGENIPTFEGPATQIIDIVEGDLKSYENDPALLFRVSKKFNIDKSRYDFDYFVNVPYSKVEDSGIEVLVTYYDEDGNLHDKEAWDKSDNYIIDLDTISNKTYVRVDSLDNETPRIYFNLGGVGKNLRENTEIRINALISSGVDGEIDDGVELTSDMDCEITSLELIMRGTEEESNDSVKKNAPLFHNSANRLVTKLDYEGFIGRDSRIKESSMWDGADEEPLKPGHIWLSYVPQHTLREFSSNQLKTEFDLKFTDDDNNWYMEEIDVVAIESSMKPYNIPTLRYHHRHPIYFDFNYTIRVVRYNRSKTNEQWNQSVFNIINKYFKQSESFNFEYFQSNLDKRIDVELNDDTGFNISLETSINISNRDLVGGICSICSENTHKKIVFHLGTPFERFLSRNSLGQNEIDTSVLPRIGAVIGSGNLSVDFDSVVPGSRVFTYDITLEDVIVGKYRVFIDTSDTVEIELYIKSDDGYDHGLLSTDLDTPVKLNIEYVSPNFKFTRNTIPRLKSIKMVSM